MNSPAKSPISDKQQPSLMREVSAAEYAKSASPTSFMQTTQMAKQRESMGQTAHFFQYKNEFVLLNGIPYPRKNSKYLNYNIWFSDRLSLGFIRQLRTWCRIHNGLSLTITPNTPISIRNNHGETTKKLDFNQSAFIKNHFKSQGLILTAPGTYKQWQYVIELNQPYSKLLASFKPKVRHGIATTEKTGLTVQKLAPKDLKEFTQTLAATADRRHFSAREQEYYASMLDAFGHDAYGLVVHLDPAKTRKLLQATIENSKNLKDGADIIKKATRQLEIVNTIKEIIPIYAGFFVDTPRETVYLAGGGNDQYFPFSPVYALLSRAIQRSLEHKIPRFNLYGVDATFAKPTGLLQFKQQFHGFIEQLPGDYIAKLRPITALVLKTKSRLT